MQAKCWQMYILCRAACVCEEFLRLIEYNSIHGILEAQGARIFDIWLVATKKNKDEMKKKLHKNQM